MWQKDRQQKDVGMRGRHGARGSPLWKADRVAGGSQEGRRAESAVGGTQAGGQQGSWEEGGTRVGISIRAFIRVRGSAWEGEGKGSAEKGWTPVEEEKGMALQTWGFLQGVNFRPGSLPRIRWGRVGG